VIFVITIGGLGFFAYIIMALVVPKEDSKASDPSDAIKENA